jgi:hypothetical protein
MDYVTRQFISLAKHFRKDLRKALTDLNSALHKQTDAIRKSYEVSNDKQSPLPEGTVLNSLPSSIEVHQNEKHAKDERNYKRFMFLVTTMTLGAIVIYADLVHWQYREMINSRQQMQGAIDAANRSANAAEKSANTAAREELITEENLRAIIEPKICKIDRIIVGDYITAHCDFTNAGHSKAYKVRSGSDTKYWKVLPDGPMPVKLTDSGDLAPDNGTTIYFRDAVPATLTFLMNLPDLTVNDNPGNETLFFLTRFEYVTLGRAHYTELCWHLTKSGPATAALPEASSGYMLRRCKKWYGAD